MNISQRKLEFTRTLLSKHIACLLAIAWLACLADGACAQLPLMVHQGDAVPRDVREIYDKGVAYLVKSQEKNGSWQGGHQGPGVTGMALMTMLASGEDPNFGKYSTTVRKAVKNIVESQDDSTGYLGHSMYHHGFGMLALAEAYGTVDDRTFWRSAPTNKKKSIGRALEMAVRSAITSQKNNPLGAWRYSPSANDADTSASGAVLIGLLAARNAGIEVPDASIDRAISYYESMTSNNGNVGYSGLGGMGQSTARTSIASLVYAVARRQDLPKYKATVTNLTSNLMSSGNDHYKEYSRYYQSQALFQGDMESWEKWNKMLVVKLKASQHKDGSFHGSFGAPATTSLNLLSLALNYRFLPIYER